MTAAPLHSTTATFSSVWRRGGGGIAPAKKTGDVHIRTGQAGGADAKRDDNRLHAATMGRG